MCDIHSVQLVSELKAGVPEPYLKIFSRSLNLVEKGSQITSLL